MTLVDGDVVSQPDVCLGTYIIIHARGKDVPVLGGADEQRVVGCTAAFQPVDWDYCCGMIVIAGKNQRSGLSLGIVSLPLGIVELDVPAFSAEGCHLLTGFKIVFNIRTLLVAPVLLCVTAVLEGDGSIGGKIEGGVVA